MFDISKIRSLYFAGFLMLLGPSLFASSPQTDLRIYRETEILRLYDDVAERILTLIRRTPEAVILLPTGNAVEKLYAALVKRFKTESALDFSKTKFIHMDEYIGLSSHHPLSHQHFMRTHFYTPLKKIDPTRAPQEENCLFVPSQANEEAILAFKETYQRFISTTLTDSLHLAIIAPRPAWPEEDTSGHWILKGGRLGFNTPQTLQEDGVQLVQISEKMRGDIKHRFQALDTLIREGAIREPADESFTCEVPRQALTLGLQTLLKSNEMIVIALGEDKAPVLEGALKKPNLDHFHAALLSHRPQTSWYIDVLAASQLDTRPWLENNQDGNYPQEWIWQAMCQCAQLKEKGGICYDDMASVGITSNLKPDHFKVHQKHLISALREKTSPTALPEGRRILVVSPHPDDDVISMGATLTRLQNRSNDIFVLYGVSGANSVSTNLPSYENCLQDICQYHPTQEPASLQWQARTMVREQEALQATSRLGIPSKNLIFFKGDYYHRRGVPGLSPFSETDMIRMASLLEEIAPDIIYFAAENDPNGAHGLTAQLVAQAFSSLKQEKHISNVTFYGYRGAYNEWPLYEVNNLVIVPFDQRVLEQKTLAIKDHLSQLDPLYPSFDPRPFFERARERNQSSLKTVAHLIGETVLDPYSHEPAVGAEAFFEMSLEAFIRQYE